MLTPLQNAVLLAAWAKPTDGLMAITSHVGRILARKTAINPNQVHAVLKGLRAEGLLLRKNDQYEITQEGIDAAAECYRAHTRSDEVFSALAKHHGVNDQLVSEAMDPENAINSLPGTVYVPPSRRNKTKSKPASTSHTPHTWTPPVGPFPEPEPEYIDTPAERYLAQVRARIAAEGRTLANEAEDIFGNLDE
jgi:hypothetical protein